jgi:hypothetical protein
MDKPPEGEPRIAFLAAQSLSQTYHISKASRGADG